MVLSAEEAMKYLARRCLDAGAPHEAAACLDLINSLQLSTATAATTSNTASTASSTVTIVSNNVAPGNTASAIADPANTGSSTAVPGKAAPSRPGRAKAGRAKAAPAKAGRAKPARAKAAPTKAAPVKAAIATASTVAAMPQGKTPRMSWKEYFKWYENEHAEIKKADEGATKELASKYLTAKIRAEYLLEAAVGIKGGLIRAPENAPNVRGLRDVMDKLEKGEYSHSEDALEAITDSSGQAVFGEPDQSGGRDKDVMVVYDEAKELQKAIEAFLKPK